MRLPIVLAFAFGTLALAGCATTTQKQPDAGSAISDATQAGRLVKLASEVEEQGKIETALALYERAISASDASAAVFVRAGDAFSRAGYDTQAIEAYNAALARSPKNGPALLGLGAAMVSAGDPEAGIRALKEGAKIVNTSAAYNRLGVAQTFAGRTDDALATFSHALTLSPGDLDIEINMALAAALARDSARALPLAQKIAAAPQAQLHHKRNLVMVYGLLGMAEEVRAAPPVGLSTDEIDDLLTRARVIRAKRTVQARADALGAMTR